MRNFFVDQEIKIFQEFKKKNNFFPSRFSKTCAGFLSMGMKNNIFLKLKKSQIDDFQKNFGGFLRERY